MVSEEDLAWMYLDKGMTQIEIAQEVGVAQNTIGRWMKKYGIRIRTRFESRLIETSMLSKEDLEKMYLDKKMTPMKIAEIVGVCHQTVRKWIQKHDIELRTYSEASLGENNGNWRGGTSFEPYCYKFNNKFKESVRERDGHTCQLCGYEQKLDGQKLDVHHVHYDKSNCYPDVVTLCHSCNSRVNGNRDYWEEYFENLLLKRGLLNWSTS